MARPTVDLTGKLFGRLTVLGLSRAIKGHMSSRPNHIISFYNCLCECGNVKEVRSEQLRHKTNSTKSCGCLMKDSEKKIALFKRLVKPGAAFRDLLASYKRHAKERSLCWELTDEQFKILTSSKCYYTGKEPSTKREARSGELYVYNGVDRLNNDIGYVIENCVSCCEEVNMMKRHLPKECFIEICKSIAERF